MREIRLKVAIVGSRDYKLLRDVRDFVNQLPAGVQVVSGGARGVDYTAEQTALSRGLPKPEIYLAKLKTKYATKWAVREAMFARNLQIVQAADLVVAFWHDASGGTENTIKHARALNKPVFIIDYNQPEQAQSALDAIKERIA